MGGVPAKPEQARNPLLQEVFFLFAAGAVPAGLWGYLGQGHANNLFISVVGLGCGAVWWRLRPVPASADARRWQRLCGALTIAATAGLELTAVQFLRSPIGPADAPLEALMPTLVTGAVAVPLLLLRVAAGLKLRALAAPMAAPVAARTQQRYEEWLTPEGLRAVVGFSDADELDKAADETPILTMRREWSRRPPFARELKLYGLISGIGALLLVLVAVVQGVTTSNWGRFWAAAVAFALALGFTSYTFVQWRSIRLEVSANYLRQVFRSGRARSVPIAEISSLVRCSIVGRLNLPRPTVLVTDKVGRVRLHLAAQYDVERLAEAIGVPAIGNYDDRVPYSRLGGSSPGA